MTALDSSNSGYALVAPVGGGRNRTLCRPSRSALRTGGVHQIADVGGTRQLRQERAFMKQAAYASPTRPRVHSDPMGKASNAGGRGSRRSPPPACRRRRTSGFGFARRSATDAATPGHWAALGLSSGGPFGALFPERASLAHIGSRTVILPISGSTSKFVTDGTRFRGGVFAATTRSGAPGASSSTSRWSPAWSWWWQRGCSIRPRAPE
jgi:hypothetical protein